MQKNYIILICCFFILTACGSAEKRTARAAPNVMGYSGKAAPEAELLFARARILWRGSKAASATAAVVCSNPEQALELLDKAVAVDPSYAEAYLWRGLAKSELGMREEAFADATASLRLHSTADAYAYRALISMRGRDFKAAHKDLEYSLELAPAQHQAWNFSGMLALLEGNTAAACESFSKACSAGDCSERDAARTEGLCK